SFATYPTLHTIAGIPLMLDAVEQTLAGAAPPTLPTLPEVSRLRHHPTAWGYLWRRATLGVR
ncbi:MAG: hypothetical protein KDA37_14415, partial [Planctomycetales bacterium]|nr:hypothetical protein [Planctomycetales bacterium]